MAEAHVEQEVYVHFIGHQMAGKYQEGPCYICMATFQQD